jgi:hypothetical protein
MDVRLDRYLDFRRFAADSLPLGWTNVVKEGDYPVMQLGPMYPQRKPRPLVPPAPQRPGEHAYQKRLAISINEDNLKPQSRHTAVE